MNNMFKILALLSTITLIIIGCTKKEENKLYVGTNAEFQPFEYREGNKIVGFDIDLINEISKICDFNVEIVDMKFDGLLPSMEAKKIDLIIAGMTKTDEREKFVNFSEPYYNSKQIIIVHKDNEDIKSFDNLSGKKVGVVLGYIGDLIVSDMTNVDVEKFNAVSETILALKSAKVDAIVLDYEAAKNYVSQNKELKLIETDSANEEYAIAIRKDDTELLNKINDALKTIKENGIYDSLLEKYFKN